MHATFREIKFTDSDVVNEADYIPSGEYNPHNIRPFLFHDHGFVIGVVFADGLEDALDELVDSGRADRFMLSPEDCDQYEKDGWNVSYLGNACEPFDIQSLGFEELPNPPFSFVALFNAAKESPCES